MTLGELQEKWRREGNPGLYAKTKGAFENSFRSLPKNMDCKELTLPVLRDAIRKSTTVKEFRVKAASTMMHMLEFAHTIAPAEYKRPNFTYSDILFEPVVKKSVRERRAAAKKAEAVVESKKDEPEGDDEAVKVVNEIEETMENKEAGHGRSKRRICKLDPMTFKVLEAYDSVKEASAKTNNKNIIRTIKEKRRTGGFYWCYEDEVYCFNLNKTVRPSSPTPAKKKSVNHAVHKSTEKKIHKETNKTMPQVTMSLQDFTNEEIIAEIKRRHWTGRLTYPTVVEL